ncbi:MAG: hypothetical protein NBV65_06605 [Burkholderiaceae bacterium]|nr:hypothetical protein [Burkholderiaceae bacterium]
MSSRRIDADLGFLSLAVAEAPTTARTVCPEHRSADGLRLRALLGARPCGPAVDIPTAHDAQADYPSAPRPPDHHQRLQWLVEVMHRAHSSHQNEHRESVRLRLSPDVLKDASLEVHEIGRLLVFDLRTGDSEVRVWISDKLLELVRALDSRIACRFTIRIIDEVSSSIVAEAGNGRCDHSWHRASLCES